jgi:SAM-dependent methyltransferase
MMTLYGNLIGSGDIGSPFQKLLKCPTCLVDGVLTLNSSSAVCARCGASYSVRGDILDFVAGRDDTALDVMAYDQEKQVSKDHSLQLFAQIRRVSGDLIPHALGNVLEIGAGTGLLTVGMLAINDFETAIITDISPAMLAVCQKRLGDNVDADTFSRTLFATYSGIEDIFADGAYDICIANSVVHHILDYRSFFAKMRRALKPTGTAIFIEPSGPFHLALTLAMNDTLVAAIAENAGIEESDIKLLARWIVDARQEFVFPNADKSGKEDKHVFWRDDLARAAQDAGFAHSTVLPWDFDPLGLDTLGNYLWGIGVTSVGQRLYSEKFVKIAEHHFQQLREEDKSSMYVIGFKNDGSSRVPG